MKPINKSKLKLKISMGAVFVALIAGLMVFLLSGGNYELVKEAFKDGAPRDDLHDLLADMGIKGYATIGILSMLQVIFTFLPAEPVQVIGGISFGIGWGVLICFIGVVVGNTFLYALYKIFGARITKYFERNAEFDFSIARRSHKVALIITILYFLPAIPYGMICLFTASLDIKFPKYIFLTSVSAIPSIFIGVALGHLASSISWMLSIGIFVVLIILLIVLFKKRSAVFKKVNEFVKKREARLAQPKTAPRFMWWLLALFCRLRYKGKIKIHFKNEVGKLERPSIVLCNHGSFIDFIFAGSLLSKERPHFIAARLYFYHKWLGRLLRYLGCIPKSMFTADIENAKNCLKVLSSGKVLAMMPEARLSTAGKFEDIQDSTYKFLQRFDVPIYVLHLYGDYFADPKWGKGARKGALVEVELKPLFKAGEIKDVPLEEVERRVKAEISYDEFEWLKTHPEVTYKTKNLAEGLENILAICPNCGEKYSFTSQKRTIKCSCCGMVATLDSRYAFVDKKPFENFSVWYDWQMEEMRKEIAKNPDFKLESKVELRHASKNGRGLTRLAGEGVCVLDKTGLLYKGSEDGKEVEKFFPLAQIYRLLFGAGEDFEIYEGREIWYFVPENRRSCVAWYMASILLKDQYDE